MENIKNACVTFYLSLSVTLLVTSAVSLGCWTNFPQVLVQIGWIFFLGGLLLDFGLLRPFVRSHAYGEETLIVGWMITVITVIMIVLIFFLPRPIASVFNARFEVSVFEFTTLYAFCLGGCLLVASCGLYDSLKR